MAIALVTNTKFNFGATSPSIDTTGATLLVAVVADFTFGTTGPPADSKSNTWTGLTMYGLPSAVQIFYVANPTVGSGHTFTCSGASDGVAIAAFSGVKTSSPLDQQSGAAATQPGSITPTEDNELLITGMVSTTVGAYSVNGGFTISDQSPYNAGGNTMGFALAYLIQTSAAAANPTWSGGAAACAIASFKAAAAAGGQPTMKRFGGVPFASRVGGAHGTPGVNLWRKAKELLLPKPRRVIVPGFEFARGAV